MKIKVNPIIEYSIAVYLEINDLYKLYKKNLISDNIIDIRLERAKKEYLSYLISQEKITFKHGLVFNKIIDRVKTDDSLCFSLLMRGIINNKHPIFNIIIEQCVQSQKYCVDMLIYKLVVKRDRENYIKAINTCFKNPMDIVTLLEKEIIKKDNEKLYHKALSICLNDKEAYKKLVRIGFINGENEI